MAAHPARAVLGGQRLGILRVGGVGGKGIFTTKARRQEAGQDGQLASLMSALVGEGGADDATNLAVRLRRCCWGISGWAKACRSAGSLPKFGSRASRVSSLARATRVRQPMW